MAEVRDYARRDKVDIIYGTVRLIEQDRESFLALGAQALRVRDLQRARRAHHQRPDQGGRRVPPPDRHRPEVRRQLLTRPTTATRLRRQVDACYPQLQEFLKLKLKYDPQKLFQSEWYRHYERMFEKK